MAEVEKVNERMLSDLGGNLFDHIYVAPEAPDQPSRGRKPSPQFLFDARDAYGVDLARSWIVGDKLIDLQCGWNAGLRGAILVRTGDGAQTERESGARLVALEGEPLERPLPLDEELARERARQRYHGVTQFRWLRDGRTILSLQGRRIVCFDLHTRSARSVAHADYIAAAELSPDGRTLVFASAAQLWALPMEGWPAVAARALTDDGSETLSHGVPDQITSSASSVRLGNSARVAIVAAITPLLPTTTEAGARTTMSSE